MECFAIGNAVTLWLAEAHEVLPTIPDDVSVVGDPPYGIGFVKGASGSVVKGRKSLRRSVKKVAGDNFPFDPQPYGRFAFTLLWGANHYAARLPHTGRWLAWDKTGGGRGPKDSFSDVEFAWVSDKGKARIFHYLWKGVCQDGEKGEKRHHPMQKPIALMEWCVAMTPPGTTILDPYMGAGSTGIAAIRQGRPFIGIEMDPEHFAKAVTRISAEASRRALQAHASEIGEP